MGNFNAKPCHHTEVHNSHYQTQPQPQPQPHLSLKINDNYRTYNDVSSALQKVGVEKVNLIVGVDFTKSNLWQGKRSFNNRSLHALLEGNQQNQYQHVISMIGQTLAPLDADGLIPVFGFGDLSTEDFSVFPFNSDHSPCKGFNDVLERYQTIAKSVTLSGPTSFAPIIEASINIVQNDGSYHILLIIADGMVDNIKETTDAIIKASYYPLSIVMIGVGDGPWETMETFDDNIPDRLFDNFQFVNYNKIMGAENNNPFRFALHSLMEIPEQYDYIKKNNLIHSNKNTYTIYPNPQYTTDPSAPPPY